MSRLHPDRILALDVGNRRIGVAVGSEEVGIATPLEVIVRAGDDTNVWQRLRDIVRAEKAGTIVLGDPLNMDGSSGPQSQATREFARRLKGVLRQANVVLIDERLSSFSADEWMTRDGVKSIDRKKKRDAYAAAVILLDYFSDKTHTPSY